jgi:hypothetical protein
VPILCIYFMTGQVQPKFPPERQGFRMAEVTLGEAFAGRKLDELAGDPPSGAPVTYYLLKILTMTWSSPLGARLEIQPCASIRREWRRPNGLTSATP